MPNDNPNPNPNPATAPEPENYGLPENFVPIDAPPIIPSNIQIASGTNNPYKSGTLNQNFSFPQDFANAGAMPAGIPSVRLMPVQGNPAANAATAGVVQDVINNTSIVQDIITNSPTTTGTTQQPFDNSTNLATTAYVDSEIYYGVGVAGFREDFIASPQTALSISSSTVVAANFDTPWNIFQISGGTQIVNSADGPFSNPGIIYLNTSASSGQGLVLFKGSNFGVGTGPSLGALGQNAGWQADFILDSPEAIVSSFCFRIGFVFLTGPEGNEVKSDPPTDGIWVRCDTAQSDTLYTWECRASGTSTTSTTNSITAGTNWDHLRIRSLVAGTILFSVNGGPETAINTNITTGYGATPFFQLLARSSSGVQTFLDFFSYVQQTGRT